MDKKVSDVYSNKYVAYRKNAIANRKYLINWEKTFRPKEDKIYLLDLLKNLLDKIKK